MVFVGWLVKFFGDLESARRPTGNREPFTGLLTGMAVEGTSGFAVVVAWAAFTPTPVVATIEERAKTAVAEPANK